MTSQLKQVGVRLDNFGHLVAFMLYRFLLLLLLLIMSEVFVQNDQQSTNRRFTTRLPVGMEHGSIV